MIDGEYRRAQWSEVSLFDKVRGTREGRGERWHGDAMMARHGWVLSKSSKYQGYKCLALLKGCKEKSMMTIGVMV